MRVLQYLIHYVERKVRQVALFSIQVFHHVRNHRYKQLMLRLTKALIAMQRVEDACNKWKHFSLHVNQICLYRTSTKCSLPWFVTSGQLVAPLTANKCKKLQVVESWFYLVIFNIISTLLNNTTPTKNLYLSKSERQLVMRVGLRS